MLEAERPKAEDLEMDKCGLVDICVEGQQQ